MTSVLVGMLASGENERDRAIEALRSQRFTRWDMKLIEGLPNKEAHETLYRTFMEEAPRYTHFLKVDADMVLRRATALQEMLDVFGHNPDADWITFDVHDWYSGMLIPGMQMFTSRVSWEASPDTLIVDTKPQCPGRSLRIWDALASPADHSPDPSPLQAFRFGVHRMIKALQPDRPKEQRHFARALIQWTIVDHIWKHFRTAGEARRALAVAGAELVMRGETAAFEHSYVHPGLTAVFRERFAAMDAAQLEDYAGIIWDVPLMNQARWMSAFLT